MHVRRCSGIECIFLIIVILSLILCAARSNLIASSFVVMVVVNISVDLKKIPFRFNAILANNYCAIANITIIHFIIPSSEIVCKFNE